MRKKNKANVLITMIFLVCIMVNEFVYAGEKQSVENVISRDEGVITSVISDEKYGGWELQWKYVPNSSDLLVEIENENGEIKYVYNEKNQRIQKIYDDVNDVIFNYDEEGYLLGEQAGDNYISYIYEYDEEEVRKNIVGFEYNGEKYIYKYENDIIVGILHNDVEVVKYEYEDRVNVGTYQLVNNEWVLNRSEQFIGNINKIRYKGYYLDCETGWYFYGRYLDPENNRFVDGIDRHRACEMIEYYGVEHQAEILLATNTFGLDWEEGENVYNSLAKSDEFTEVEVIARVLYAESPVVLDDQQAVAWVMYNISQWRNWTVYYTVADRSRFAAYNHNALYFNPNTSDYTWTNAVREASRLATGLAPIWKPVGYTTQRNYRSVNYFLNHFGWTGGVFYLNDKKIHSIYIVGYGEITSYNVLTSDEIRALNGTKNIFFKYYNET